MLFSRNNNSQELTISNIYRTCAMKARQESVSTKATSTHLRHKISIKPTKTNFIKMYYRILAEVTVVKRAGGAGCRIGGFMNELMFFLKKQYQTISKQYIKFFTGGSEVVGDGFFLKKNQINFCFLKICINIFTCLVNLIINEKKHQLFWNKIKKT